jgi:phage terminase large subunit-like protein
VSLASALQTLQRNALAGYRPRAGQERFHRDPAKTRCLRGPNQIVGKSYAGCAEALWWLTHTHPYRDVPDRPVAGRLVPYSDDSSKEIESKLFELLPRGLLHPDCRYHQDRGFTTGRRRMLRLRTGDSLGIVSQSAGTLAAAGATLDFVWLDEPPEVSVFAEAQSRVIVRKGSIWLTLTPIGRPVGWLREACEAGRIQDIHVEPTPENTELTQEELDEIASLLLPSERPQRFNGEWEGLTVGRFFGAFDDTLITTELPNDEVSLGLGIDHGERDANEAAILVAFSTNDPVNPKCWFLDEYVSVGRAGVEADAAGILDMLARWEIGPEAIDVAVGDHNSGGKSAMGYGVNQLLTEAIARASGLPTSAPPFRIKAAKKGAGSVSYSSRLIHSAMVKGNVTINPRCKRLIDGFRHWTGPGGGQKNKDLTHVLDAARYIGREFLDTRERGSGVIKVR